MNTKKIEDITYTRVVCCSAGAPQEEHHRQKTATCSVVFPDDSSLPKQKQICSEMFFHSFPSSIENIWYLQCFPKNYPNMFQGMVFRSWSSLRQKKHGIHSLPEK